MISFWVGVCVCVCLCVFQYTHGCLIFTVLACIKLAVFYHHYFCIFFFIQFAISNMKHRNHIMEYNHCIYTLLNIISALYITKSKLFIEYTYFEEYGWRNEEMSPVYVGKASRSCSKVFVIGTFSPINGLDTETCGVKPFDIGDI